MKIGRAAAIVDGRRFVDSRSVNVLKGRGTSCFAKDAVTVICIACYHTGCDVLNPSSHRVVGESRLLDAVLLYLGELVIGVPGVGPGVGSFGLLGEVSV
jgi:hypothetical protein